MCDVNNSYFYDNGYCDAEEKAAQKIKQLESRVEHLENALRPFAEAGSNEWDTDPDRCLVMTTKGKIMWDDLIRANKVMKNEMD